MADAHIHLTLVEWLDDLCVRFLVNLPQSELSSVPRLCFQVEEAQWFYEDFVRPAVQASGAHPLPHLPLRQFCLLIFQHCPLLSGFTDAQHLAAYEDFLSYKVRVPVRGAILLDQNMEKLVLVRGWKKGASWSFPRGKINKDERDLDCAIREVYEETGFDLSTSGLIPEHENDIKYIDVTMREQHMRLFVFRGVPEDTYFETKTRKEISKISWYWIKDLPGFKKQSKQQQHQSEAEIVHANKFYMVAPFLGHLKKWIGQQRKKDIVEAQRRASAIHGPGFPVIEDESEDQQPQQYPSVSVVQREDELKRLLSIGAATAPAQTAVHPDVHSGNLLAMLQGGAQSMNGLGQPHTPFEQINPFPSQPETPHPQHLRQAPLGQQQGPPQPPPQFPSPQRMQYEQQRHTSQPAPGIFGPLPVSPGYHPNMPPGMIPPHLQQQQFQQRPPTQFSQQFEQQNPMHLNGSARPPVPPQMPIPQPLQNAQGPSAFIPQGPQGAIASGPAAPSASQLPAPNLNQHTINLLNAFKGGNPQSTTVSRAAAKASSGKPGAHQTALLDLFKKPATATPPAAQPPPLPAPADPPSPAPTDATERPQRPSKAQERKPTLNEITRTLTFKPKAKATPPLDSPIVQDRPSETRPKSRQLFDPNQSEKPKGKSPITSVPHSPVRILQRPSSSAQSNSPNPKATEPSSAPSTQDSSSKRNGHRQQPSFTILARPGSSKGTGPAIPPSPPKTEAQRQTPPFQPQLLKRNQPSTTAEGEKTQLSGADTKEQLFRLFEKSSTASRSPAIPTQQSQPEVAEKKESVPTPDSRTTLLDLFKVKTHAEQSTPPAISATAIPPPAPRIQPTTSSTISAPSQPATAPSPLPSTTSTTSKQQTLLLNLFNKSATTSNFTSSSATTTPTAAPLIGTGNGGSPLLETPISPFALGTPVATHSSSIVGALAAAGVGSGARTVPAQAQGQSPSPSPSQGRDRDFLMGYLNGVVRGAGK